MYWKEAQKTVSVERYHRVHCGAVSSKFVPPPITSKVSFNRYQLLLSIGRNLAMGTAKKTLIGALAAGRSSLLQHLVDNTISPLRLSSEVGDLGDSALTSLSHDIGVGISGLHMESMGYTWRANGKEVFAAGDRIPDYVWDTATPGGGLVVSEAKGATSIKSNFNATDARACDGMFGQVIPRIGKFVGSEQILAGYAFGVCATGGKDAVTAAYEAMDFTGGIVSSPTPPSDMPSTEILRQHFAGVFRLLGLSREEAAEQLLEGEVRFEVISGDRQQFVIPKFDRYARLRPVAFEGVMFPALNIDVAERALELMLIGSDTSEHSRVSWPRYPFMQEKLPSGILAVAPDGLALVSTKRNNGYGGAARELVRWRPSIGFVSD